MPNGFWYAGGDTHTFESAIPSSAFSKGDLLTFTSNSSLSRINPQLLGADIAGVATSDSIDSIDNQCSYIVPGPDTLFWASLDSASGSALRPGTEADVLFAVANNRYYVEPDSTNTAIAVIVRGSAGVGAVDQSVQSKVLCKLIYHSGQIDLS
jgi:hypothetical protein